ncbi:dehydrogenase/reductase SDR family member 2, mitochondrial-like [Saccopteryx leptura]|uniref:dehydrogenase/reductase SDR family member 2, mitochondrial-like n=1 Tax=Saccopteryx leptura TaxID=249018 RepID=UPI00339C3EFB
MEVNLKELRPFYRATVSYKQEEVDPSIQIGLFHTHPGTENADTSNKQSGSAGQVAHSKLQPTSDINTYTNPAQEDPEPTQPEVVETYTSAAGLGVKALTIKYLLLQKKSVRQEQGNNYTYRRVAADGTWILSQIRTVNIPDFQISMIFKSVSPTPSLHNEKDLAAALKPHYGIQFKSQNRTLEVGGRTEATTATFSLRIGFAIAQRLAQDGAHVVVSSRKQQNVDRAVAALQGEGLSVTGTACHVGKAEDRERLVATALEHCGGVDILVSVAVFLGNVGSTLGTSEEVWDKILNVNLKAPALLLNQLLPHMEKRGGISVVLVSSLVVYTPLHQIGAYNVSKTAILGLTKTLSKELAPKNIRVNCLMPGVIDTPFSQVVRMKDSFCSCPTEHQGTFPYQNGKPEDCSGVVSFLCSPDASYIKRESIVVAGCSPHL